MKLIIDIAEARYKDIQRIAEVQHDNRHFITAEQIIAKGTPLEQEPCKGCQYKEWLKEETKPKTEKQKTGWIPVKFRPLTKEEQEKYPDYCCMADCLMPDEGDEILVTTIYGTVEKDEAGFDDGFYLDSGYDWEADIVAWMPLPEPYKEG